MQVETFECSETAAEPVDASAEAIGIIESLGLAGQQELLCPAKAAGQSTRFPYREMLRDEEFVYRTLCPQASELARYNASPIPLRVLQCAAHVRELMPGLRLVVWDRTAASIKDPVLVAESGKYEWSIDKRFIIARWGAELETFAVLTKRAIAVCREQLIDGAARLNAAINAATDASIIEKSTLGSWI